MPVPSKGSLPLQRLNNLAEFRGINRQRRLGLQLGEKLGRTKPLRRIGGKKRHDFLAKVFSEGALARRSSAEEVEVDEAGKRVGLRKRTPSVKRREETKKAKERTADSLNASLINLFASCTSSTSTFSEYRILACASESRIILSSCLVVAVMRRSFDRASAPALRIST